MDALGLARPQQLIGALRLDVPRDGAVADGLGEYPNIVARVLTTLPWGGGVRASAAIAWSGLNNKQVQGAVRHAGGSP